MADQHDYYPVYKQKTAVSDEPLDCRSEEGITVGLIDALISIGRILRKRDLLTSHQVREAMKDLHFDADMRLVLTAAELIYEQDAGNASD